MIVNNPISQVERTENQWRRIYKLGGVAALIVVCASLLDIAISILLGGSPASIPQTAVDRFIQFQSNPWVGLYYLDLLNMTTAVIMIPAFFAICAAHRRVNIVYSGLALIVFSIGTAVFITNNTALPMLSLSGKYALATSDVYKNLLAAAGEAMLTRGAHASPGVFVGFLLPVIASLLISFVMLNGGVFSKATACLGIVGYSLFIIYFVLVTFIPGAGSMAMALATIGGLLTIAWLILFAIKLLKLRNKSEVKNPKTTAILDVGSYLKV
jgi:hypothetical protein